MVKVRICPVCKKENDINALSCLNPDCENPFMLSLGRIVEKTEGKKGDRKESEEKDSQNIGHKRVLYLRDKESGKLYKFEMPAVLNRHSFQKTDYAISEEQHVLVDGITTSKFIIICKSRFNAVWINENRLYNSKNMILGTGDILRLGNSFFEVVDFNG